MLPVQGSGQRQCQMLLTVSSPAQLAHLAHTAPPGQESRVAPEKAMILAALLFLAVGVEVCLGDRAAVLQGGAGGGRGAHASLSICDCASPCREFEQMDTQRLCAPNARG